MNAHGSKPNWFEAYTLILNYYGWTLNFKSIIYFLKESWSTN